ncbi:acyltransferase [Novosphingobium sp.]|uniref:acyltransferase family protein n=1 Tax=Novosphingobium sp. TaxID=1874826 RepID=UPI00261944C2|nr:acyltransferase [Novosphingobium sp.]
MTAPSTLQQSATSTRLVQFDGLRGLAALFVLLFHFSDIAGETSLFSRGYLAVDFFFMLSGFVLVPVFEAGRGGTSPTGLLMGRVTRFWPLLALGALIGALVHAADPRLPGTAGLLLAHLLLAPGGDPNLPLFPLNQAHWSLWCELLLNALHLWILRKLGMRALLCTAALCWLFAAVLAFGHGSLDVGAGPTTLIAGLFRATSAYAFGIVLRRSGAGQSAGAALPWWTAPAAMAVLMVAPPALGVPARYADPFVALLFIAIMACAAGARLPDKLVGPCQWLGALSFPLYAIHYPVLEVPKVLFAQPGEPAGLGLRLTALAAAPALALLLARSPLAAGLKLPRRAPSQLRHPA